MTKPPSNRQRRQKPDVQQDILEWHGMYDDDNIDYITMILQDALEPKEAACAIYPRPPGHFEAALKGDDGRMDSYLRKVEVAIRKGKLESFTHRGRKLVIPEHLLDWAWRSRLIDERLKGRIQRIRAGKKGYSGSTIPSLRKDNEILGVALSILGVEYKPSGKRLWGKALASKIEDVAELFWDEGEPPKRTPQLVRLLNGKLGELRNHIDKGYDYIGLDIKSVK